MSKLGTWSLQDVARITPHLTDLGRGPAYEKIDAAARVSGARILLGAGVVPGISSVMVRALSDMLGGADTIETSLLLSASDVTGPASLDYFLQELTMSFDVHVEGVDRRVRALSEARLVAFPSPLGRRRAYLFPFSDQVLYPRTMGAHTAITRLALDPPGLADLLAFLVRSGVAQVFARECIRRAAARARPGRRAIEDALFALRVDVRRGGRSSCGMLVEPTQADATAAGTAGLVHSLLDGEVAEPGAWMPEQVIDPPRFFARLARDGFNVSFEQAAPHGVAATITP